MIAWLLGACIGPTGTPLLLAEDGGAGIWPGNTRYAVERALDAGVDGIELDVGLTADGVPVVVTGGELGPTCEGPGGPLTSVRASQLDDWTCGGIPDPRWPSAEVSAEPVPTLADIAGLLIERPPVVVELTLAGGEPELLAASVLDTWFASDPSDPLWFASHAAARLEAVEIAARARGIEASTRLVVPGASSGADLLGFGLPDAGQADGLALPWEHATLHGIRALAAEASVELLDVDEPGAVAAHRHWPIDALRTGYPGDLP
jgi:hypothetical protein